MAAVVRGGINPGALALRQWLQEGVRLQMAGDLASAEAAYRRALELDARQPDALNLIGVLHCQRGDPRAGEQWIRRAIEVRRNVAEFHMNLGNALREQSRFDEAANAYRKAQRLRPDLADVPFNLGVALRRQGRAREALPAFREAVRLRGDAEDLHQLGACLLEGGRAAEALAPLERAVAMEPSRPEFLALLGDALHLLGREGEAAAILDRAGELAAGDHDLQYALAEAAFARRDFKRAEEGYTRCLSLLPGQAAALHGLGLVASGRGEHEHAAALFRRVLLADPHHVEARVNLGNALRMLGQTDEAMTAYQAALVLAPDMAQLHANIGALQRQALRLEDAIGSLTRAIELKPNFCFAYSMRGNAWLDSGEAALAIADIGRGAALDKEPESLNALAAMCMASNYVEESPQAVLEFHRRLAAAVGAKVEVAARRPPRDPDPRRPLRLGYISPDFRRHSVASFFEPLLEQHDRARFELYGYYTHPRVDSMTQRLRARFDHWFDAGAAEDTELAERIAGDDIDILIDLAGCTEGTRPLVLARRPAPLQLSYLGYPTSPGNPAIDFRITDSELDPPGSEASALERPLRLEGCLLCFRPLDEAPAVGTLPASGRGFVTFGSFNSLAKVGPATVELWSRTLLAVPGSRLVLKARALADAAAVRRTRDRFAAAGVDPSRLELLPWHASQANHLDLYNGIDIALDTYPYHGVTTTCEALWMGVPVVSRGGATHAARHGTSLLRAAGLAELSCADAEAFAATAAALAADLPGLAQLRRGLRARLAASPLADAGAFAGRFEAALLALWDEACAGGPSRS